MPSSDIVDDALKRFVRSHLKHWSNQVNYQLTNFKDKVSQRELLKKLSLHRGDVEQIKMRTLILLYFSLDTDS